MNSDPAITVSDEFTKTELFVICTVSFYCDPITILLLAYYRKALSLCPHFSENYTVAIPLLFSLRLFLLDAQIPGGHGHAQYLGASDALLSESSYKRGSAV
ncbi:hypothetical protein Barb6_00857 [Bacteroidales bacterium Barb6]|nr:hypothetical protein Barb6_00857 [Bacteroidales bacterium Barb6]